MKKQKRMLSVRERTGSQTIAHYAAKEAAQARSCALSILTLRGTPEPPPALCRKICRCAGLPFRAVCSIIICIGICFAEDCRKPPGGAVVDLSDMIME